MNSLSLLNLIFGVALVASALGAQANERAGSTRTSDAIVYHGKLVRPGGAVINGPLTAQIKITSPEPTKCLLWAETQTIEAVNGGFSIELGYAENRGPGVDGGVADSFRDVFINNAGLTFVGANCAQGSSYTPTANDDRLLSAVFVDNGVTVTTELIPIKSVPFAKQAQEISGYGINNLMKISGGGAASVVFSPTEVQGLKTFAEGKPVALGAANTVLGVNGAGNTMEYKSITAGANVTINHTVGGIEISATGGGGGGGSVTSVGVSGLPLSVVNATSSPVISIAQANGSQAGFLSAADWTLFNSKQPAGSYLTGIPANSVGASEVSDGSLAPADLNFAGSMAVNTGILVRDGNQFFNKTCSANETLIWTVANGWICDSVVLSESDPQVGANTTNALSKWDGSALVASGVHESGGSIGIGTQSPTAKVSIQADIGNLISVTRSSANPSYIDFISNSNELKGQVGFDYIKLSGWYPLGFHGEDLVGIGNSGYRFGVMTGSLGSRSERLNIGPYGETTFSLNDRNFTVSTSGNSLFVGGGNIGVGTMSPTSKLHVNGTASFNYSSTNTGATHIDAAGAGGAARVHGYSGDGSKVFLLNSDGASYFTGGNVGLGTTSPSSKLEVAGQLKITGGSPGAGKFLQSDATGLASWTTLDSSIINNSLGYTPVNRAGDTMTGVLNLPSNGLNVGAGQLIVTDSGKVGVGVGSPSFPLDVSGDLRSTGWLRSTLGLTQDGSNDLTVYTHSNLQDVILSSQDKIIMKSGTSWTERMRIDETGNVGIGTSSPQSLLQVGSSAASNIFTPEFASFKSTYTGASNRTGMGVEGVYSPGASVGAAQYGLSAASILMTGSNTSVNAALAGRVTNYSSGSVNQAVGVRGMGCLNSGGGTINTCYGFFSEDQTQGSSNVGFHSAVTPGAAKYAFFDAGGAKSYFSGNVGIGTTTPGEKLTVAGIIESTSGGIKFPDGSVQVTSATTGGNNSMFAGWPDAIVCNVTIPNWGPRILYAGNMPYAADGRYYYYEPSSSDTAQRWIGYNSNGTFGAYGTGYTTTDCNVSISSLVSSGKTYNFAKGPAAQWLQAGSSAYYNAGKVGIGTSSPQVELDVAPAANGFGGINTWATGDGATAGLKITTKRGTTWGGADHKLWSLAAFSDDTTTAFKNDLDLAFWDGSAWTTYLSIDQAGKKVGIGTASPGHKLEVTDGGVGDADILIRDTTGTPSVMKLVSYNGTNFIQSGLNTTAGSSADLVFGSMQDNDRWMVIKSNGIIGVGTSSPNLNTAGRMIHIHEPSANAAAIHFTNSTSGSAPADGLMVGQWSDGNAYVYNYENTNLIFGTAGAARAILSNTTGNFIPGTDGGPSLGQGGSRWAAVHAVNGTIQTSDRRMKREIQSVDLGLDFIQTLQPVTFKWKEGSTRNKVQYGLIAQDLEKALLDSGVSPENGIINYDKESDSYGVNYSQLIAPIIKAIQEVVLKLTGLSQEVEDLKSSLESKDSQLKKQQEELQALKSWACQKDPQAPFCK